VILPQRSAQTGLLSRLLRWGAFAVFVAQVSLAQAVQEWDACEKVYKNLDGKYDVTAELVGELKAFAKEHNLPVRVLKMGPPERQVDRVFVGLDFTDKKLEQAYLEKFHLEGPQKETLKGVLPIEFEMETKAGGHYVSGVLRPSPNENENIWRWGRPDYPGAALTRKFWFDEWASGRARGGVDPSRPIWGYSHLIGLDGDELANVKHYLHNPDDRGPCKSDNCVAWVSNIELGKTAKEATSEERGHLFPKLGMARSSAHYEIGRRLMHAANERHSGVVVFLNGAEGIKAFDTELEKHLPSDPQIPYAQILRDVQIGMKKEITDAVSVIPDGGKVFFPIAAGASPEAFSALIDVAKKMNKGVDAHVLVNGMSEKAIRAAVEETDGKLRLHALFLGGNMRKVHTEGKMSVIPGYLSDFPRMMRDPKNTDFDYDAIVVRVSPPDANGNHSLGPNYDMIKTILDARPNIKVIAEINPNVPFTTGRNTIPASRISSSFKTQTPLAGPPVVPMNPIEAQIGRNLADIIPSKSYVQLGIGNIFGGLPSAMADKGRTKIKFHTEMLGDPMKQMMESGVAESAKTGFAYGSQDLYKWLDHNEKVVFQSTEFINDPAKAQALHRFHAVNTALQVNIYGDANATIGPGGKRISSPGGQVEFMSAGHRSKEGKSIIAIRSTAKNGEFSSISMENYGGSVTTPREMVTHVVTEYGTAILEGKTEAQRALNLINVAHPKFRAQLFDESLARGVVKQQDRAQINFNEAPLAGE